MQAAGPHPPQEAKHQRARTLLTHLDPAHFSPATELMPYHSEVWEENTDRNARDLLEYQGQ